MKNLRSLPDTSIAVKNALSPLIQMVGLDRIELSTSRLSGVRSNHLSYRPIPLTPALSQRERGKCTLRRSCVEEATLVIMVSILWSKAP